MVEKDADGKSKSRPSGDTSRTPDQPLPETHDARGKVRELKGQGSPSSVKKKAPLSSSSTEPPPATNVEHGSDPASRFEPDKKSGNASISPQGPIYDSHKKKSAATNLDNEQTQEKSKSDEGTDEEHGVKKLLHKIISSGSHSGAPTKENVSEGKATRPGDAAAKVPKAGKGETVASPGIKSEFIKYCER